LSSTDLTPVPRERRRRTWRGRALRLALSAVAALVLFELALRWLLFGGMSLPPAVAQAIRHPERYARSSEDLYWQLRLRLKPAEHREKSARFFDPDLGWLTHRIDPETYAHREDDGLAGRRPVLFFGDSFAACTTPDADCFQGLLERSDLGADFALLNYGVGGFGVDQTWLLLDRALTAYGDRDPVVVFSLLVDDDLDRAALSMRNLPKPRLVWNGTELVHEFPVEPNRTAYLEAHPPRAVSFAWRWLLYGSSILPADTARRLRGDDRRIEANRLRCRRILTAVRDRLADAGVDHFVLVFAGRQALSTRGPWTWREPFLVNAFRELDLPYVTTKGDLLRMAFETGRPVASYFGTSGMGRGHYTAEGNRVAFRALERGLRGEFAARR